MMMLSSADEKFLLIKNNSVCMSFSQFYCSCQNGYFIPVQAPIQATGVDTDPCPYLNEILNPRLLALHRLCTNFLSTVFVHELTRQS